MKLSDFKKIGNKNKKPIIISASLHAQLRKLCKANGISMQDVSNKAIEEAIAQLTTRRK